MKKTLPLLTLLLLLAACSSGKKADSQETQAEESTTEVTENEQTADPAGPREPTDDELNEYGLIKSIEDSGYPLFAIDVEFPERQMTMSFSFNLEESPLSMEELTAMKGKYATLYYLSDEELQLADVLYNGKTILGDYGLDDFEGFEQATGQLAGADEATPGDLPGTVTVTTGNGSTLNFEYFVTDEMVAVNQKEVTVYYYSQVVNKVTYLMASEE